MSDNLRVAVGYFSSGINDTRNELTGPFVSRGWWSIQPGQCQTFDNPFSARYMFWFALAQGLNDNFFVLRQSINNPAPNLHFCVPSYFAGGTMPSFTYEDENVDQNFCESASRLSVVPRKVDTYIQSRVDVTGQ